MGAAASLPPGSSIDPANKFAFSANAGWIDFGDGSPSDGVQYRNDGAADCGVNHDGAGNLSGYAYGENVGWINLGTGNLVTSSMAVTDVDGDEMADAWELSQFGNLSAATASSDADGDGASDKNEYTACTDPRDVADFLRILSQTYRGNYTEATVVFTTDPSRLYRLETSGDLGVASDTWVDCGLGTFAPDAGATTTRIVSWAGTTRKFIRAVALRPLP